MSGCTVIHQQSIGPTRLRAWCKWLVWLHCVVCCHECHCPGCVFACFFCQCHNHIACRPSILCGGSTYGIFLLPLVFVCLHCLLEKSSSILHLVVDIACLTFPPDSYACFLLDFDLDCSCFWVELASFADLFPFDLALACLLAGWRAWGSWALWIVLPVWWSFLDLVILHPICHC